MNTTPPFRIVSRRLLRNVHSLHLVDNFLVTLSSWAGSLLLRKHPTTLVRSLLTFRWTIPHRTTPLRPPFSYYWVYCMVRTLPETSDEVSTSSFKRTQRVTLFYSDPINVVSIGVLVSRRFRTEKVERSETERLLNLLRQRRS